MGTNPTLDWYKVCDILSKIEDNVEKIIKEIGFPMFVKPSNSGSSVGVKKATNREELKMAIENAGKYDRKNCYCEN